MTRPSSNDDAWIGNDGTAVVTSSGAVCKDLRLGSINGSVLQITSGDLTADNEGIGSGAGSGTLVQTGGTNTIRGHIAILYVGYNANGTYDQQGGELLVDGDEHLGEYTGGLVRDCLGTFNQSGGTHTVTDVLSVGYSSMGSFVLSGSGYLSANREEVGRSPYYGALEATFTQTGGTNHVATELALMSGSYMLSGSGSLSASSEYIGKGTSFRQSGGVNNVSDLRLNSTGSYELSGSGVLSATHEDVGTWPNELSVFVHSGGTNTLDTLRVGTSLSIQNGPTGEYRLSGSAQLSANVEMVGDDGMGVFTQTGGVNTVGTLYLGHFLFVSATYPISGSYTLDEGNLAAGWAYLGQGDRTQATFTQNGGVSSFDALQLGDTLRSTGVCNLNGGVMTVRALTSGYGAAIFNFNGGTLKAGSPFSTGVPLNLATSGGVATIDSGVHALALTSPLSGPGSLAKIGSGKVTLSAANTFTGTTSINVGTLALSGGGSLKSSRITVATGATYDVSAVAGGYHLKAAQTLAGAGTTKGGMTVDPTAWLAPGDSPGAVGTLHFSGSVTLLLGSQFEFDLAAPDASDQIATSLLALYDQRFSDFHFMIMPGFGPGTYRLIDASLIQGGLGSERSGTIDGLAASLSTADGDLLLTVVPEPTSFALLGIGALLSLTARSWRRLLDRFAYVSRLRWVSVSPFARQTGDLKP